MSLLIQLVRMDVFRFFSIVAVLVVSVLTCFLTLKVHHRIDRLALSISTKIG